MKAESQQWGGVFFPVSRHKLWVYPLYSKYLAVREQQCSFEAKVDFEKLRKKDVCRLDFQHHDRNILLLD